MLGTKTRQVAAYGRRGHRIVNVDDSGREANVKNDSVALPQHRIDDSIQTPRSTRYGVYSVYSATASPDMAPPEFTLKTKPVANKTGDLAKAKKIRSDTRVRKPLAMVPANVLSGTVKASRSPLAKKPVQKLRLGTATGKRAKAQTRIPLSMKPVSLTVDVEILVLDDTGKQFGVEKRKTNPTIPTNPLPRAVSKPAKGKGPILKSLQTSIDEEDTPSTRARQAAPKRRRAVIISSDEDSDIEVFSGPEPKSNCGPPPASPPPRLPSLAKRRTTVLSSPEGTHSSSSSRDIIRPPSPITRPARARLDCQPGKSAHSRSNTHAQPSRLSVGLEQAGKYKPRPLTPIRSRAAFPAPPSPPSPTTPSETDAELSFDFAELALSPNTIRSIEAEATGLKWDAPNQPVYLQPLLKECGQDAPHEFSAFIEMFPFDPIVQTSHNGVNIQTSSGTKAAFRKIGEASYSEVFGIGDVVLKIIPLRNEEPVKKGRLFTDDMECPAPSDVKDVLKEIVVTRAMGELCIGFVELLRTYIVRGKYPSLLLDLWDEYHERKGSESVRPDSFPVSQVYAIIVLPNGGPDLESYTFTSSSRNGWRQACSLFWQVTRALAEAEDLVEFEHRDLHWGQILVKNVEEDVTEVPHPKMGKVPMDDDFFGVRATIIDLGLSRMNADDGARRSVHWTPFDEETFEGEGDYQFEVYRMMQMHNEGEWKKYRPLTNVMWLHYLVDKLLHSKRLRKPYASKAAKPTRTSLDSRVFSEAECHASLVEVEASLKETVDAFRVSKKGRRKTQAVSKASEPGALGCAGDVLGMARERGWLS
ncbi:uncharacterized protein PHACADRAFT_181318 [Phanerochaete carnosa HHB-10118-sp]|uniref:non-specific serine/threonine protein kinase n=1 Tax=Phanerochaete carnosa (strain HHB-10118-sp) TaxID=650164 RepID=K5WIY6_PHACS|nr:uncharacterized protein PHACADRAFT_181318 [Phanerochaete carnosa HHB-10118-sp]EKM59315.1 hypothetical protein PHACADRAFT_181318 [Phanerochaete carnosa HHB-10118-sp]